MIDDSDFCIFMQCISLRHGRSRLATEWEDVAIHYHDGIYEINRNLVSTSNFLIATDISKLKVRNESCW